MRLILADRLSGGMIAALIGCLLLLQFSSALFPSALSAAQSRVEPESIVICTPWGMQTVAVSPDQAPVQSPDQAPAPDSDRRHDWQCMLSCQLRLAVTPMLPASDAPAQFRARFVRIVEFPGQAGDRTTRGTSGFLPEARAPPVSFA